MSIFTPVLVAPTLEDEVAAVVDAGLYASEAAFLSDAVHTLLAARPDLRQVVACQLYARGLFSLGRAAEWANVSIEQMKQWLNKNAIERTAPETLAETEAMARVALQLAGR